MNPFLMPAGDMSAIQEWALITSQILNQAQGIIDSFARVKRISTFNAIDDLIDTAEPGAIIGDSTMTKEQAVTVRAILTSFGVWLETPLADAPAPGETIMPIAYMSKRR